MPITIAIVAAIAKAGCFLIGSLVHEVNELTKRFGVDEEAVISRAPSLLIKDEQLGRLQETPKVPSSNALVLYASRAVVLRSRTMSNDSLALESQFDVVENSPFSVLNNLRIFAAWYLARCIALMQSALCSFVPDMKVAISSFFGSVSERVFEKKAVSSILFLIQVNFSRLIAKVVIILKEAIHLIKSRTEKNISTLLGRAFPAGIRGKQTALPLCSVVGDSLPVNVGTCTLKNLTMTIACVKQALAILVGHSTSLHRPLQLLGVKMTTLVCLLLCVSISVVGWSIPLMLFDGSTLEQGFLQHPIIPEAVLDLEAGALSSITSRLTSLPGDTSNSLISMESISNVVDLHSVSAAMGTIDRQADLNRPGLADYTLCMLLWQANDFSTASTPSLQSGYSWNDKTAAALPLDWNIEATHCIQSESSLFYVVKAFDGYTAPTIADAAFTLTPSFIAQASQNQSSIESLGRSLPRSVSDEDTASSMSMLVGPPKELSTFQNRERLPAPSDRTSGFAKPKASVSSVSISRPKSFFAAVPSSLSFNALKDSTNLNIFCELRQLALMLLMLAYCNTDGITDEPDDVASTSEISPGTDLDLEEAPDDEVIYIDEENGAETEEVFSPITNLKPSKRELTALHSELGRHWKSPSKRRRRRSSRICGRPNYFEPI